MAVREIVSESFVADGFALRHGVWFDDETELYTVWIGGVNAYRTVDEDDAREYFACNVEADPF